MVGVGADHRLLPLENKHQRLRTWTIGAPNCMSEGTEPTEKALECHHKVGVVANHCLPPSRKKRPRLRKRTVGHRTALCKRNQSHLTIYMHMKSS